MPSHPSLGSLLLLAASFHNGLAVFHVGLPVVSDKSNKGEFIPLPEPTASTQLSQTPPLLPISVKRWQGIHDYSSVCWIDLGPHINPCLGMTLGQGAESVVLLGTLRLPTYRRGPSGKDELISFDLLGSTIIPNESQFLPSNILHASGTGAILCNTGKNIVAVTPSRANMNANAGIAYLKHPISSCPPGLTSACESLLSDANSDKDGVLHIYTIMQYDRQKFEANASMQIWSKPKVRHWLCRTLVGDTKAAGAVEEEKKDSGFGDEEVVKGGASTGSICELFDKELEGLVPLRVVRCKDTDVCAVLYRIGFATESSGTPANIASDATSIAYIDFAMAKPSIRVVEGRDALFLPANDEGSARGLILSKDGSTLTYFVWDRSAATLTMGQSFRPIVGVDTDMNFVDCRRIFGFAGPSDFGLLVVGTRRRDGRSCLVAGNLCTTANLCEQEWSQLLPNIVSGRTLWLDVSEEVFTVVGLEGDESGYRNFAIASSSRVAIVSSGLEIASETSELVSSTAMAPLGSFAVAFISEGKLRYLSCLDSSLNQGLIATLAVPRYGYEYISLTAVRPDRLLFSHLHSGVRTVEINNNPNVFLLPTALTRPALILEPMLANAICVGGKGSESTAVLRTVIEKFGRKVGSLIHDDGEGIGNTGAGITSKSFEMLNRYGLHIAANWLLTGTVLFDRAANTKVLPPWLPIAPKSMGVLNADAFMHVAASGDPYFGEYIKEPDQNMPSTMPRQSSSTAYVSAEYAKQALAQGRLLDSCKLFDVVGGEFSESLILQLALALGKDGSTNTMPVLKSLSGYNDNGFARLEVPGKASCSLAALAVALKQSGGKPMTRDQISRWMKPLAPSVQKGAQIARPRQKLFGTDDLSGIGQSEALPSDSFWVSACSESKHVW
jgi:hypothetical protein